VLFSEPKIPQCAASAGGYVGVALVSVLFSEPKIPQSFGIAPRAGRSPSFSALQRAENSSIAHLEALLVEAFPVSVLFSEPKIPQFKKSPNEPSPSATFQCSSASRKFLNSSSRLPWSAPQIVSVLFSEPKIPQFGAAVWYMRRREASVSVLFSEPKIPQWQVLTVRNRDAREFQCSSASRKFLNTNCRNHCSKRDRCFSALQRAENSSINSRAPSGAGRSRFQCSSASRKFLN